MHPAGVKHKARVTRGYGLCASRGRRRLTDTDKGPRTSCAGPFDGRVRIVCERGVGQVHVAIGEDHRWPLCEACLCLD
jgi:hypothetical protein